MKRFLLLSLAVVLAAGCGMTPERESLRLLPEGPPDLSYPALAKRCKLQVDAATEAFYADDWLRIVEAGRALDQSARFLPKATDPPPAMKERLASASGALARESGNLIDAATKRDEKGVQESLQQLQFQVRALRP